MRKIHEAAIVVLMPEVHRAGGFMLTVPQSRAPFPQRYRTSTKVSHLLVFSPKRDMFAVRPRAIVGSRGCSMNDS
jgi:hypothetical protein